VRYGPVSCHPDKLSYPLAGTVKETVAVSGHRLRAQDFKGNRADTDIGNGFGIPSPEFSGIHKIRPFPIVRL